MATQITNQTDATAAFKILRQFIGSSQIEAMADVCRGEEKGFMFSKLGELLNTLETMPQTYQTDGQGQAAIAHLHYFINGCDWYITDRRARASGNRASSLFYQRLRLVHNRARHGTRTTPGFRPG